jgi:Ankyrin repeats (3 copies)
MDTRAGRRAAFEEEVLCAGILQVVLDFVGPGHCLNVATVCKAWQASYKRVASVKVAVITKDGRSISIDCTSAMTFLSLAFTSPDSIRRAYNCGLRLSVEACAIAGRYADISTLAAAHELGLPWSASLLNSAALSQRFDVLKWLHIDAECPLPQDICSSAAAGGSVDMLQWLIAAGCDFDAATSYHAALAGHMHVLQFLRGQGCPFDKDCVDAAAERGDLAMVQWLLQQGCPWRKSEVVHIAAESGSIALMEWLLDEHRVGMTVDLMASAAEAGQLAMCQYLREQGCPWGRRVTTSAASGGQLHVLRWLHEAGCPWRVATVMYWAVCSGSDGVEIFEYLLQQGMLPDAEVLTRVLADAGAYGKRALAVWLRLHGTAWPAVLVSDGDVLCWSRDMVAWARAEGCTSPVRESYLDPYSEANRDDRSAASDGSDEFSSCSDTDESSSDHNFDSDASSTLHTGDTSSDDSSDDSSGASSIDTVGYEALDDHDDFDWN